jgi:hypothetical protein
MSKMCGAEGARLQGQGQLRLEYANKKNKKP